MSGSLTLFKTPEGEAEYMAAYGETMAFWPVAFEAMTISTRYGSTYVVASGPKDGKPLVLLHGMNASSTMWCDSVDKFADSYRTYAVDIIGEPNKSVPTRPMLTRQEAAEWLNDVLDQLDIKRCNIVGISKGAWLAMNLGLALPDRINRLVLLAPAGVFVKFSLKFWVKSIKMLIFPSKSNWKDLFGWMCVKPVFENEVYRTVSHQMFTGMKHQRFQQSVFPSVFSDDELRNHRVPTLILFGENEVINNSKAAFARASKFGSNLKLHMIPDAGHAMAFDQPELICKLALEFLAEDIVR